MPSTRDVLVDAAEQIVRERGLDALTIRTLAAETNYGKSTVHSTVGGIGMLTYELRLRAAADMGRAAAGEEDPDPTNPDWRIAMFSRIAGWMIANPKWAEAAFATGDTPYEWSRPMAPMLAAALPPGVEDLDDHDGAQISELAARSVRAVMPFLLHVGDHRYGGRLLESVFQLVVRAISELLSARSLSPN